MTAHQEALLAVARDAQAPAERDGELLIVVRGKPRPKGSMRHVGNGRMIEQISGSGDWRVDVKMAALAALSRQSDRVFLDQLFPLDCPVEVEITFTFTKPASARKTVETYPDTRSSGDADKLARNVLDSLEDAGVLKDDARVIDLRSRKRYPGQHADTLDIPGAVIRVRCL